MKLFQVHSFITHLAFKTQHPPRFKTSVQQDREEQWWNKALRPKEWKKDLYEIKCWRAKVMQRRSDTRVADFWSVLLWRQLKTTWHSWDRGLERRGNAENPFQSKKDPILTCQPRWLCICALFQGRKKGWRRRHPISRKKKATYSAVKACKQTRPKCAETCLPYMYSKCRCWWENAEKRYKSETQGHKWKFCEKQDIPPECQVSFRLGSTRQLSTVHNSR